MSMKAGLTIETKSAQGSPDVLSFTGSTEILDRGKDIVEQNWDLKNFKSKRCRTLQQTEEEEKKRKIT